MIQILWQLCHIVQMKAIRRVDWITIPVMFLVYQGYWRPAPIGRHWANVLHQSTGKHTLKGVYPVLVTLVLLPAGSQTCIQLGQSFSRPLRPVRVFIDESPQYRLIQTQVCPNILFLIFFFLNHMQSCDKILIIFTIIIKKVLSSRVS